MGFVDDTRPSAVQMAQFDALAPAVRAKLRDAPFDISPNGLEGLPAHLACLLIDTSVRMIQEQDAR